ncbi:MAG: UDP-glucose 4-epimerase GalE [Actinobacteria bacterium]|nr:UDP-glucose 4-epimerase GalE [Actinomycetota bacterium]
MTTWLVTGGAGYIGAHVARRLQASGRDVVVVDDLSTGFASFVPEGARFLERRIHDLTADDLRGIDGVVHLAALKYAGLSVQEPLHFYRNNVDGMAALLEAMVAAEVWPLVYSGSCSVYGTPAAERVDEDTPIGPESPYGETKLLGEWLSRDVAAVHPLRWTSLRYFNVVGSAYDDVYDASPHNLFPLVFRALDAGEEPLVHGTDYPTPDGSCIRDYIHVGDLADAHVLAAEHLEAGRPIRTSYNIGTGTGASVLGVIDSIRRVLGRDVDPVLGPRRAGDPARIIADGRRAREDLGWTPEADLDDMVRDAWASWRRGAAG